MVNTFSSVNIITTLLHSVNLILFTVLLVHLILRISPHSHHLHSHHLSLSLPSTPDLKPISFTNSFLHSHSYSFRTVFTDLNLYWIKGALACSTQWPRLLRHVLPFRGLSRSFTVLKLQKISAWFFTARCTLVQSAVLRSHVVCLSVCLSVCL